jgi:hypothetical protein
VNSNSLVQSNNSKIIRFAIFFLLFFTLFKDALTGYPVKSNISLRYIDDILIAGLYAWLFIDVIKYRSVNRISSFYLNVFLFFLVFHLVQFAYYGKPLLLINYILFIRDNFWYFPVFYFSVRYLIKEDVEKAIRIFLYVQIAAVITQILFAILNGEGLLWEDDINGTLGANSSHILSYALMLCLPILYKDASRKILILIWVILVLASARSAIFFYVSSVIFIFLTVGFTAKRFLYSLCIVSLVIPITFIFVDKYFTATFNPVVLYSQQNADLVEGRGAARLAFLEYSIQKIDSLEKAILGYGSGTYSSRTAVVTNGEEYQKFNQNFPFLNEFISGGSTYNGWIVEYGYIVFIVLILCFLFPVIKSRKNILLCASLMTVFFGLSAQKLMESYSVAYLFWLLIAYFNLHSEDSDNRGIS